MSKKENNLATHTEIYKPPQADLSGSLQTNRQATSNWKYTFLGFILSPLITAMAITGGLAIFSINSSNFGFAFIIFIYALIISYVCMLIFGLPYHWIMGKLNKQGILSYLLGGLIFSTPISLFQLLGSGMNAVETTMLYWFFLSISASLCAGIFWYIAIYRYKKMQLK